MKRSLLRLIPVVLLVGLVALLTLISGRIDAQTAFMPQAVAQGREFNSAEFAKTFTQRTANVNGVRLHYVIGGRGEPVVLLHGWPQTWYEWHKIMPALASRYTVIAPDMRGFGTSDKPASGYEKTNVAEDIYQLVQQLGFKQVNLMGHDIGGMVSYAFAAQHPETVRHLVLTEFVMPGFGLEELMDVARGGLWHFGFHMQPKFPEMLTAGKEREYLTTIAYKGGAYNKNAITDADIDTYLRTYAAPGGMTGGFNHYRTLLEDGRKFRELAKRKLQMPVLVIVGEQSGIGNKLIGGVRQVADNVQNDEIRNSGHWLAEEQPEELTRQLFAFFNAK